ncbi:hypothetical protein DFH08DRAFT_891567 [Mycena albidolilacea]|uniref:Uncharacterized protein n=1 Tax=Mycena albidolilacea TaxID=1033008 RepID=A0AAD6ZEP3_9AGAR|nr:hypothetical protein DFH08DRAFT_891567 [Mycena albidolilacea]
MSAAHPPFVAHDPKHVEPDAEHPHRAALHSVPDLRFEYGFLKSVRPYFRLRSGSDNSKGKEKQEADEGRAGPVDTLEIQWLDVAWVTTRDQVLSPLAQGALWAIAGYFLTPVFGQARSFVPSPPEGGIVKWLRSWVHSVGVVTPTTPGSNSQYTVARP